MNTALKSVLYLVTLIVVGGTIFSFIPGIMGMSDFAYGYNHPVGGTDHLLAMIAVGLLSVQMVPEGGPRTAIWAVPACFVVVLAIGGLLGLYGIPIDWAVNVPFNWLFQLLNIDAAPIEVVILASMVILGIMIISQARFSLWVGLLAVAFFALYHGHAHGQEMGNKGALWFFAGFMLASAVIHIFGVLIGELGSLFQNPKHTRAIAGAILTGAGGYMMFLSFAWI